MSSVVVTLPDGSTRSVDVGTPVRDVAALVSPRLARAAVVATVNGRTVDLS
jgi:threonyl-tRNA synthetase